MTTGDYWFTYVYKSQAAERIRAAEQERSPRRSAAPIGSSSAQRASGAIR